MLIPGEYFYSSTNENGEFGLQLDDGHYKIELVVVDGALDTPIYLDKDVLCCEREITSGRD